MAELNTYDLPPPHRPRGFGWARRSLTPIMRVWRTSVRQSLVHLPRPLDDPRASAGGINSDRILVFGAGLAVGWGVKTHDLAIPGFLARTLSALTGRGTDVAVVADPDSMMSDAINALKQLPLGRYDAVVIVLGVNEAIRLNSVRAWRNDLTTLLAMLRETVAIPVVVTGINAIRSIRIYDSVLGGVADAHAVELNRASAEICAQAPNAIFVSVRDLTPTLSKRHRGPDSFAVFAQAIAAATAPLLALPRHREDDAFRDSSPNDAQLEALRQSQVDALDLSSMELGLKLDRLLSVTQLSCQVTAAAFTVLDHDRQVLRTSGWAPPGELQRAGSFCDTTIRRRGGLVVPDAQADERFRDYPLVAGAPHVRFYAGFPIESPSGERIGSLCAIDVEPHPADYVDMAELRTLALRMQRELHELAWR